ncbi:hypothetical protein CH249_01755 [Rhodococcus sp. 05-2255-3B1]|uniref:SGNH/GDSL hydrolase family protein n=1 Tax=unclassified Rhodococcus (in: high G+C Gram-positive bacteria) TaxID=192944 RepID=UPI000B9C42E4|nr:MULTISPECIES: SGNH/GDSL hydrolase family protein [unclassified Rhodococcus (in: high G+C Gram-positive bacteria)]OZE13391.1 hypothetical protein CH250_05610 [Rhodococcus sp. 05-2255-3C]OZE15996.1 hypothetical protein CH249_01755 [Rhodococcus sp. 05-2255-3B1]OZE19036.1 hypothetical protein CH255_13780 [Rhodococcus sp. 05-2255-2A2]
MPELVTPHWVNRLVRRDERAIRLAVLSDSQAEGFAAGYTDGVPDVRKTWPALLAEDFARKAGVRASLWLQADTPNADHWNYNFRPTSFDGTTTADRTGDTNGVPGSVWLNENNTAGQTKSLTWPLRDTYAVDVFLGGYPEYGTGAVTITLTLGDNTLVNHTVTPTSHVEVFSYTDAKGIASVKVHNAVNGIQVLGVLERQTSSDDVDDRTGIEVYNFGFAGKPAADFAQYTDISLGTVLPELLAAIEPDLVIIALGGNDAEQGRTAAQLEADLVTIATHVNAQTPDSEFLFVAMQYDYTGATPPITWADYRTAIANAASTAAGSLVVDTQYTTPPGGEGLFVGDGVHFKIAGARSVSDAILPTLWPR